MLREFVFQSTVHLNEIVTVDMDSVASVTVAVTVTLTVDVSATERWMNDMLGKEILTSIHNNQSGGGMFLCELNYSSSSSFHHINKTITLLIESHLLLQCYCSGGTRTR